MGESRREGGELRDAFEYLALGFWAFLIVGGSYVSFIGLALGLPLFLFGGALLIALGISQFLRVLRA